MPVSIQSFSFGSINRMKPPIDSGCLYSSSITVKLKMQICVIDDVLIRSAQKALFSVDVSFRCELQKTSKKLRSSPKVRFFSSTMASACFCKLPLLVKHCYISFKQLIEIKNIRGQLSTSSGVKFDSDRWRTWMWRPATPPAGVGPQQR